MKAEIPDERLQSIILKSHSPKYWVKLMQSCSTHAHIVSSHTFTKNRVIDRTVPYLIDSLDLFSCQVAVLIDCVLFQKESDFVARVQEVVVADVIVVSSREFGLIAGKAVKSIPNIRGR